MHMAKPHWLKRPLPSGNRYTVTRDILDTGGVHTVCRESGCPNMGECFSAGVATFLILGNQCTRGCGFCGITHGSPVPLDSDEPSRVADTALALGLRYVVVTSVTRDDLPDGGAGHFERTVAKLRTRAPDILVETLIPDFLGSVADIRTVVDSAPDVISHNVDTVPRLFHAIRPGAEYSRSLDVLRIVRNHAPGVIVKSGLILGLGEKPGEIRETLAELLDAGCRVLALGQYLRPSSECVPAERYVTPGEFEEWRNTAMEMGFTSVRSGPLVRSSFRAGEWCGLPGNLPGVKEK